MNRIVITNKQQAQNQKTYLLSYEQANKMLPILRSDHFLQITLTNTKDIQVRDLKFLIQLTRLLKQQGKLLLTGQVNSDLLTILLKLNLYQQKSTNQQLTFTKNKKQKKEQKPTQLAIGFAPNQEQETIDQNSLMEGQNLQIKKKKVQNCQTKPRACANCSCGRKDNQTKYTKEQLIKSINQGKTVSGCGKCSLGDSFRCGTCPYKGLPSFKPGDKLKLDEEGSILVEAASTYVSSGGKIKLEL